MGYVSVPAHGSTNSHNYFSKGFNDKITQILSLFLLLVVILIFQLYISFAQCINQHALTALTLLDLSAAFDTIDYSVLLDRLSDGYGLSGTAFSWIRSFLVNRFEYKKNKNMFFKCSAFVLRCSPRLGYWSTTIYPVSHTTTLTYSLPQIRPSFICRWHPSIHICI